MTTCSPDLLRLRHHVCRQEHGGAAGVLLEDDSAQRSRADGVEAAERLVEDQQVGLVQNGGHELHLLRHPLGQLVAALPIDAGQADALEGGGDPRLEIGAAEALQAPHVAQERPHPHLPVETALLGQVANPVLRLECRRVVQDGDRAGVRKENRHQHPDRSGLPRAVGADEAVQPSARDLQVQPRDGGQPPERLGHARHSDRSIHDRFRAPGCASNAPRHPGSRPNRSSNAGVARTRSPPDASPAIR